MPKIFPNQPINTITRMHDDGIINYWFYHKESFPSDCPLKYRELVDKATSYIEIWDPYFNIINNDHLILSSVKDNITIKILTLKGLPNGINSPYLIETLNKLKLLFSPDKNIRFGMRVINEGDAALFKNWFFHDRFLFIDQNDVYLVGSSIGYHLEAHLSTGIYMVNEFNTKQFIKSLFTAYWNKASKYEIPIKYLHT